MHVKYDNYNNKGHMKVRDIKIAFIIKMCWVLSFSHTVLVKKLFVLQLNLTREKKVGDMKGVECTTLNFGVLF
jgi:hypothetical protein